jgi:hypothetical protein
LKALILGALREKYPALGIATGLVKQIIDRASLRGLQVAPSGKAN